MKDVCSLGIAKKLKEAGWPQVSGRWWWLDFTDYQGQRWLENGDLDYRCEDSYDKDERGERDFAAPTISELLEALPKEVQLNKDSDEPPYWATWNEVSERTESDNPADALALLLLALVEKGIVKL